MKERNNINVSLKKRNKALLNNILNSWEKEGCNLSSEVCDAIILKNLSNENPHIQTILSTLSLIESSLKSHSTTRDMEQEEIRARALSIFNEVITIDIDGNKLTSFLKGIDISRPKVEYTQAAETDSKQDKQVSLVSENKTETKEDAVSNKEEEIEVAQNDNQEQVLKEVAVTSENIIKEKEEVASEKSNKDVNLSNNIESDDIFNAYAMPSGFQS